MSSPRTNWVATFHAAAVDTGGTAYTEVAKTTIQAYSGYASLAVYISAQQGQWFVEGEPLVDVSGWKDGTVNRRRFFDIICWPFLYNDSSTRPDLTDIDTIAAFLTNPAKPKLWLSIVGGSRAYPTDTTKAHPIVVLEWAETPNFPTGTRGLRVKCEVKARS